MKLSVCLIVKNEEKTLPRLMESVKAFADEIVIVDTGSEDGTPALIEAYADVRDFIAWENDFSKARNHAFSLAHGDYLMWLDADDVVPASSLPLLQAFKKGPPPYDAFFLPYCTAFDEDGTPTFRFQRERIIKRSASPLWVGKVHETISFHGSQASLDIPIYHFSEKTSYSTRNMDIYLEMEKRNESFSPRDLFYFGRELYYHKRYNEAVDRLQKVIDNPQTWIEDRIAAARFLAYCHEALTELPQALSVLYASFAFTGLRPDTACDIGRLLYVKGDYAASASWYRAAFLLPLPKNGFCDVFSISYTPALGLCLAYDKLGDKKTASAYNDLAGAYRPKSEAVRYNRHYFQGLGIAPVEEPLHILLPEAVSRTEATK